MDNELEVAQQAIANWHLGQTSAQYESGGRGPGTISTGKGDKGGVSYGAYQLSSAEGTVQEYLASSRFRPSFDGLVPATSAFNEKWRELARTDPEFGHEQHLFVGHSHYEQQLSRLETRGLDLRGRGSAVQDMIWSTSVQCRGLTPRIVTGGLEEKFPQGYKLEDVSDRELIEAVQDYKVTHNNTLFRSSPELWRGLLRRANDEKADLLELLGHEEIIANANLLSNSTNPHNHLYRQSLAQIHAHEASRNITPGPHSENLAAALTVAAIREGLHRVDRVELNDTGGLARAVQVSVLRDEPGLNRTTLPVGVEVAIAQPLAWTSEQARQLDESRRVQAPAHQVFPGIAAPAL